MFDISGGEFLLIGLVALVVIGPKELPGLLRGIGQTMGKLRTMAGDFRRQFDDAMREAELTEAQKSIQETADLATSAVTAFNPLSTIRNEIQSTVDEIKGAGREAEAAAAGTTAQTAPPASLEFVDPPAVQAAPPIEILEAPPEPEPAPRPKRPRKKISDDA